MKEQTIGSMTVPQSSPRPVTAVRTFGRVINDLLALVGLRLSRVQKPEDILDPAQRSIAMGLSTREHNARDNMDAIYADPHFLTHYMTEDRLAFYKSVRAALATLQLQPAAVIDAGCGSGHLLNEIKTIYPAADLFGVDFSPESIRVARRLHPGIPFDVASIFELKQIGRQFDLVICSEVLEHLEDADVAMMNLAAVCKPGGTILVTVPNGRRDTFEGHFNFWTVESFRREFRAFGPVVTEVDTYLFAVMRRPGANLDG